MATATYGTIRPSNVSPSDVDIFYTYTPSRDIPPQTPVRILDATNFLTQFNTPLVNNGTQPILPGLYNLNLSADLFSAKGYYTIMIRPKQFYSTIFDCGVLSAYPDIKGLVFDSGQLPTQLSNNDGMVGYRIEYLDDGGNIIPNTYRIVTSANLTEAVSANIPNTTQKSTRYRFNDSSNLLFTTVTPSSPASITPNKIPFIGTPGQSVVITNTFFNPVTIELEMVEYDTETLAYGLFGNQSKGIQDGKYTIYNFDNQIYKQYNLYEVQDQFTGEPLFEIREETEQIDSSKDFDTITNIPNA
tara:strand:+ start:202 stop:1104 length:903 start_codon:yes stop_codon:yes gene_type:complete